ncbi:MAG: transcriptional regulator [Pseudomonadota bacterium]
MTPVPHLDPVFHQPVRTRLAALLRRNEQSFAELKVALEITDGNLDAHMKKLTAAGYVHSRMVLEGRPHTRYQLSPSGVLAFDAYREALQTVLGPESGTTGEEF